MPFRLFLIIGCILFSLVSCNTEEIPNETDERGYNQELLDKAAQNENYDYNRTIEQQENPFFKFLIPVLKFLSKIFGSWVGYALLIGLLILIIITILKCGYNMLLPR